MGSMIVDVEPFGLTGYGSGANRYMLKLWMTQLTSPNAAAVVSSVAELLLEKKFAFGRYRSRIVNANGLSGIGSMG